LNREALVDDLKSRFENVESSEFRGQTRIVVPKDAAFNVLEFLKESGFDLLADVTCVDYLNFRDADNRFGLAYLLADPVTGSRLTVRVMLDEPDLEVESVTSLWRGANWLEREVWDMFGIWFAGHPDLRRILLPEKFAAHPLRKDYPLQGRGERHNFPVLTRGEA